MSYFIILNKILCCACSVCCMICDKWRANESLGCHLFAEAAINGIINKSQQLKKRYCCFPRSSQGGLDQEHMNGWKTIKSWSMRQLRGRVTNWFCGVWKRIQKRDFHTGNRTGWESAFWRRNRQSQRCAKERNLCGAPFGAYSCGKFLCRKI